MLENGQTYFKNLAVFTTQDFKSMSGHFTALCIKGLILYNFLKCCGILLEATLKTLELKYYHQFSLEYWESWNNLILWLWSLVGHYWLEISGDVIFH